MNYEIEKKIKEELDNNGGKIGLDFILDIAENSEARYFHPTPSMRLCVLVLPTGHEVLGKAQVLDPVNDVEDIGNDIAYKNAVNEIWSVIGTLAKVL